MAQFNRITFDPQVMGGKPCIRGMRVTVGTIAGLIASGATPEEILDDYPYLERSHPEHAKGRLCRRTRMFAPARAAGRTRFKLVTTS